MTNEELVSLIREGRDDLTPKLWEQIRYFVKGYAGAYYNRSAEAFRSCGADLEDLEQECYFAFLDALKQYDPGKGFTFITFLKYPIRARGAYLLGIRNGAGKNNKPLDNSLSLDAPINDTDGSPLTFLDTVPDPEAQQAFEEALQQIADDQTRAVLSAALQKLSERERGVIIKEFFEGMTQKQIAEIYGVSSERVRQIKTGALRRLRANTALKLLREEQHTERQLHFDSRIYNQAYFTAQKRIAEILRTGQYLSYGKRQAIIYECFVRQMFESGKESAGAPADAPAL